LPETKLDRNLNVYISRGNSKDRKIEQEEAIEKYFEDSGYRIVHFENESFFEAFDASCLQYSVADISLFAACWL